MTCKILDSSKVSLNGSVRHYGGVMQSLTLNFGDLTTRHKASVTLVLEEEGTAFAEPAQGDKLTIEIQNQNFGEFIIESFSISTDSSSANTLRIELRDISHKILDHDYLLLKDEFGFFKSEKHTFLGCKYGPIPDEDAMQMSLSWNSNTDTKWGDIRSFYQSLKNHQAIVYEDVFPLDEDEVDYKTVNTSGKTLYWWQNPEAPINQKTLKEAIGDLLEGDINSIPDGPYDYSGTRREVIIQLCNELGYLAYFNNLTKKVRISRSIQVGKGIAAISKLESNCKVLNKTQSSDFSRTHHQWAMGSFSSASQGETYQYQGVTRKRCFIAKKLDPDFSFVPCGLDGNNAVLLEPNEDFNKAVTAAANPKIFAAYALETILLKNAENDELPKLTRERQVKGRGANKENITDKLEEVVSVVDETSPVFANYNKNKIFEEYYTNEETDPNGLCNGANKLIPVTINTERDLGSNENKNAIAGELINTYRQLNEDQQAPFKTLGEFLPDKGKFKDGLIALHKQGTVHSLLEENGTGFGAEHDVLRLYLLAIHSFKNRFFVIRGSNAEYSAKISGREYGYLITTDTSGLQMEVEEGYEIKGFNPLTSVLDTQVEVLKQIATAGFMMYQRSGDLEQFRDVAVIDLVRALEENELDKFFKSPEAYHPNRTEFVDKKNQAEPLMHILYRTEHSHPLDKFADADEKLFKEGNFEPGSQEHIMKTYFKTCSLPMPINAGNLLGNESNPIEYSHGNIDYGERYSMFGIKIGLSSKITPASFQPRERNSIKVFYNVDTTGGSVTGSDGHFTIQRTSFKSFDEELIFSSGLEAGLSINAADLGLKNKIFTNLSLSAADPTLLGMTSIYSKQNQELMIQALEKKVLNHVFIDDEVAKNTSVSILMTEDLDLPKINMEEGLESLSISAKENGQLILNISVGNKNKIKQKEAARKLMQKYSKLSHNYASSTYSAFSDFGSQTFIRNAKNM